MPTGRKDFTYTRRIEGLSRPPRAGDVLVCKKNGERIVVIRVRKGWTQYVPFPRNPNKVHRDPIDRYIYGSFCENAREGYEYVGDMVTAK